MQTLPGEQKNGKRRLSKWLGTGPLPPPEWWDSSLKGKISFPEWNLFREYWVSVARAPLDAAQRAHCYSILMEWLFCNAPKLVRDVAFAAEHLVAPGIDRPIPPASSGRIPSAPAASSRVA